MKKILKAMYVALVCLLITSCSDDKVSNDSPSLTVQEINLLKGEFPGVKFDFSKSKSLDQRNLNSYADYRNYLQSINAEVTSGYQQGTVNNVFKVSLDPNTSTAGKNGCGNGTYTAPAGEAGIFSDFQATFQFNSNTGVNDMKISTTGVKVGWAISNQSTSYDVPPNSGNSSSGGTTPQVKPVTSGCTTVTATFGKGVVSWDKQVHINFNFDTVNCRFTTSSAEGPCGTTILP